MSDDEPKYLKKIRRCAPTILISLGTLCIISGIVWSLYQASLNHPILNTDTLIPNGVLLVGTFFLGWGFYLKGNHNLHQKLSDYGHFMFGLAALITLPQAPEMLRNIMEIREGVKALQKSQEKIKSILEGLSLQIINNASNKAAAIIDKESPETIKKMIRSLTSQSFKERNYALALQPEISDNMFYNERSNWGPVYLSPENADKIISSMDDKNFNKENVKSEIRKNLEVWGLNNKPFRKNQY